MELDEAGEAPDREAVLGADTAEGADSSAGGAEPAARLCARRCSPTTRGVAESDDDEARWVVLKGKQGGWAESLDST